MITKGSEQSGIRYRNNLPTFFAPQPNPLAGDTMFFLRCLPCNSRVERAINVRDGKTLIHFMR
jgi:hypothetical protein